MVRLSHTLRNSRRIRQSTKCDGGERVWPLRSKHREIQFCEAKLIPRQRQEVRPYGSTSAAEVSASEILRFA
jgi:hypothetical protein